MALVCDTSVLIDLERAGLLKETFSLPYRFSVPDVLYHREIRAESGNEWGALFRGLRLQVHELSSDGVSHALRYRAQQKALSIPDIFALALAKERRWLLLTGDRALRELAAQERVECHGVLWLMDQVEKTKAEAIETLFRGLTVLANHPRCRLRRQEAAARLNRYRAKIG